MKIPQNRRLIFLALAIVLVLALAVAWRGGVFGQSASTTAGSEPPAPPVPVAAATARLADVPVTIDAVGTVQALNTATIHTQVDGRLVKLPFNEGEDVKKGFESISGFSLGGLVPPLKITPQDHEGGGWVKVYQVKGGSLQPVGDWFRAYPDILQKNIQADANRKS